MKTALIQLHSGENKEENVKKAVGLAKEAIAQRCEFILLPEVFNYRGRLRENLSWVAEEIPGPSIQPLLELAKQHGVWVLAGSVYEKIEGSFKAYNTSVLMNDRGQIQAKYRKRNLFDLDTGDKKIKESEYFLRGQESMIAQIKDFSLGLSICYDIRFPDLYHQYAYQGAEILSAPSCFLYETGKEHWEILLRARAIENLCYVLAPNQIGDSGGTLAYGHSMIIDPWGKILAEASEDKEEMIFADLNKDVLLEKRKILPSLRGSVKR